MYVDIFNACWLSLNMANGACSKDGRKNVGTFSHTFNLYLKKQWWYGYLYERTSLVVHMVPGHFPCLTCLLPTTTSVWAGVYY